MVFPKSLAITILLINCTLFAGNHVAARTAFDDGAGLVLALVLRSSTACLLMLVIALVYRQSFILPPGQRWKQLLLGVLISLQSLVLYSAVSMIPVAVALLMMSSWPILYISLGWLTGRRPFHAPLLVVMILILGGLCLVLDLPTLLSDHQSLDSNWLLGVSLALTSSVFLCGAMWLTNYHLANVAGGVRSFYTMLVAASLLTFYGLLGLISGSFSLPTTTTGYVSLFLLSALYGVASCVFFILAPRLDLARTSPVLNFEPVASLFLGAFFLHQFLKPMQLAGGAVVIAGIVIISLIKE